MEVTRKMTLGTKERIRYIVNKLAQQTMRGNLTAYCWFPLIGLMVELIWAAYESRHPSVANYFTVDLAILKELSQELADLFHLTLPVTLKNGWTV